MNDRVVQSRERFERLVEQLEDSTAVLTLVDLGVFDRLFESERTAEELGHLTGTDAFRLSRYLNLTAALGFLSKTGDKYRIREEDRPLFDPNCLYRHGNRLQGLQRRLKTFLAADQVLKSGTPLEVAGSGGDVSEEDRRAFSAFCTTRPSKWRPK